MSHDDLTPRTPHQPSHQPSHQPAHQPEPPTQPTGYASAAPARRSRRTWWVAGGAVAGLALLGGGIGVGALVADARDEGTVVVQRAVDAGAPAPAAGSTTADQGAGTTPGTATGTTPATGTAPATGTVRVDQDDIELTGTVLEQATSAAVAAAGGEGVVTEAERSDDPTHTYEVEVTRADGTQMHVYLDDAFGVVATETWHRD
jgi:peptidase YpeB-like protein